MGIRRNKQRLPFAGVSESAEFSATTTDQRRRRLGSHFSVGQNGAGPHARQVVRPSIDPQPLLQVQETNYSSSEVYDFKPLKAR